MITLEPIGIVRSKRIEISDDYWGEIESEIILDEKYGGESLKGIEEFSHIEVIFYFDRVKENEIRTGALHPRGNMSWPEVGIFAQRKKERPNRLGHTIVKLLRNEGRSLYVKGLDAINGTPVIDIKPVLKEFLPSGDIIQPNWAAELMKDYFK